MKILQLVLVSVVFGIGVGSSHGQRADRKAVIAKLNKALGQMRGGVWTARMTGCGGWQCDDATVYFRLPGEIEIQYDKPNGSRVVSDGKSLYVFNSGGTEISQDKLVDTQLWLLLHGKVDDREIEVLSVEEYDRGKQAGDPRHVLQIDLRRKVGDGQTLKVFVTKDDFRFLGWTAAGPRGGFTATLRDVREEEKPKASLFRIRRR